MKSYYFTLRVDGASSKAEAQRRALACMACRKPDGVAMHLSRYRKPSAIRVTAARVITPNWQKMLHVTGQRCSTIYRDNALGLQREKWCFRRESRGPTGYSYHSPGASWFIDGDPREFKSEAAMLAAFAKKRKAVRRLSTL